MFGYKRLLAQYEARLNEQKLYYDARISDLKDQISHLSKLVRNETSSTHIPLVHLEADSILSQKEETISLSPEELERLALDDSEANRILSGNY